MFEPARFLNDDLLLVVMRRVDISQDQAAQAARRIGIPSRFARVVQTVADDRIIVRTLRKMHRAVLHRRSSAFAGRAFIDCPAPIKARTSVELGNALGPYALDDNGRM